MRKRKSVKKGDDSEAEPEDFQDSGEDWTPEADPVCI